MGKYVIESKFENTRCFLEVACENREPYFFINRVDSLTPYTEPDPEQVKADAYSDGYKAGREAERVRQPDLEQVRKEAYQQGYEQGYKDGYNEPGKGKIQVGDEVNAPFGKAIVVNIDSVAKKIWLVYADGHGGFEYFKDAPTKTGRHFPEIAEVLQKMKETDNG